ncbi:MAG: divergent polysaccharide deacetylase family protein, partial [Proteobacteria bacterium]|nr:divergent polysaccharide deacetylase family protein [Pseudomonadota bacterium]
PVAVVDDGMTPTGETAPEPPLVAAPEPTPVTEPVSETAVEPVVAPPAPAPTAGPEQQAAVPSAPQLPQLPKVPPLAQTGRGLPPAPDPALIEQSSFGPLPRIGANGREPWQAYARPVASGDDRPRIAIILSGLGLSSAATEAAIQGLPGEVTLAFQPFADNIQQWIRLARAAGHEVLLNLPMEPVDFPANDPGPRALFVTLSPDENEERLRWALSQVTGYVGVVNHMGSRFTTSREATQPILAEIKARGLLYVDARSSARSIATVMASQMQVPRAINDRFLDSREVSRVTIDARLIELERIAKDAGVSIAIGQAFPVTIERVREWAQTLDSKGLALVPVSAVVNTQADR